MMRYRYTHTGTEATTGYFSCEPETPLPLAEALSLLDERPLDDFLRRHLLARFSSLSEAEGAALLAAAAHLRNSPALKTLIAECCLILPGLAEILAATEPELAANARGLLSASVSEGALATESTPLVLLRRETLADRAAHSAWAALLARNIQEHRALPAPDDPVWTGLPSLYGFPEKASNHLAPDPKRHQARPGLPGFSTAFTAPFPMALPELHAVYLARTAGTPPYVRPSAAETAALAEERLRRADIPAGLEMRHTASLSPVALLRPWRIRQMTECGRHRHCLEGTATTYGRGLSLADARASCLMEMVERASCYCGVANGEILDRLMPAPLTRGRRSELLERGLRPLDPNDYPLETPYEDAPLYWTAGHDAAGETRHVPLQMAGLFCNLDEVSLFDSPGSTGIATGRTLAEAKVAALTEIIERDAEATTLFAKDSCFVLETGEQPLSALLADYAARGINVQFQDLTGPMGVPVYKCFVVSLKGRVARGHGAGLSARRALIAALTETPFPYPDGGPSGPLLRKLPRRRLENFPDYSLPAPEQNLALFEELLAANGRPPVYVELTRRDLEFPVVRAFIPGLELAADSDHLSRVPLRLYARVPAIRNGRP